MQYQVSITSQGQVTLPVEIRREWGLSPGDKVQFTKSGSEVNVTPSRDFLSLEGSLRKKVKKKERGNDDDFDGSILKYTKSTYGRK